MAVLVVKWSTFPPYTPTILVRIPLKSAIFLLKLFSKRTNLIEKRPELGPFAKITKKVL